MFRGVIIFGCGYVGMALARACLARGWRVTALTRNPRQAAALRDLGVPNVIVAELTDPSWGAVVGPEVEVVVNTVSAASPDMGGYVHSYVEGTEAIRAWARIHGGIGTYIYSSSTGVYTQGGGEVITEAAPTGGSPRADVLRTAEDLVFDRPPWSRSYVLRLAGIYGPGRHHLLDALRQGESISAPDRLLNLIYRDDIVDAVLRIMEGSAVPDGRYNLADGQPETKEAVGQWLAQKLGLPPPRFVDEREGARGVPHRVISSERFQQVSGWRPAHPTFREGYGEIFASPAPPGAMG